MWGRKKPEIQLNTYKVYAICTNCFRESLWDIPKGTKVLDIKKECSNCGVVIDCSDTKRLFRRWDLG